MLLAGASTVGALFGTPVAAALLFTGILAALRSGGSLWDRLFLPVAAAGAGATTMHLLGAPPFAFDLPAYGAPQAIDFVTGSLLTCAIVLIGLAMLYVAAVRLPGISTRSGTRSSSRRSAGSSSASWASSGARSRCSRA